MSRQKIIARNEMASNENGFRKSYYKIEERADENSEGVSWKQCSCELRLPRNGCDVIVPGNATDSYVSSADYVTQV